MMQPTEIGADSTAMAGALLNAAIVPQAHAMIACRTEVDVQRAVRSAAREGERLAVVSGGHDMFGRAFEARNVVLDLRPMKTIRIDEAAGHVTVGPGVLSGELLAALPADRAVVVGLCLSVGVVGFALAGGYGDLTSRFGLGSDGLVGARVVLADGEVVEASERANADLLWALRGGGGGFGVVTSATFAVRHVPQVLAATIVAPLDAAADALCSLQAALDASPRELSIMTTFATPPGGEASLVLPVIWTGDPAAGERIVRDLSRAIGGTRVASRTCAYRDSFDPEVQKTWPRGHGYQIRTRTIDRLDSRSIAILVEGARRLPSPMDVMFLHDFHGAATEIDAGATAFPLRTPHFVVEMVGIWGEGRAEQARVGRAWVEAVAESLNPVATAGGYPNLLGPDELGRVQAHYGANAGRLIDLKRRFDPHDRFRSAVGRLSA